MQFNWILPIHSGHVWRAPFYTNWINKNVLRKEDFIVFLMLDQSDDFLKPLIKDFNYKIINSKFGVFEKDLFESIISDYEINHFFCHASFAQSILGMKETLLSDKYINRILCIWHEGGFLRRANPDQSMCMQLDWMGWNAWSSLAKINVDKIKPLNKKKNKILKNIMINQFLPQKINFKKKVFSSKEELKSYAKTDKKIVFLPLQVETDSVLANFCQEKYRKTISLMELASSIKKYHFIIKDHPKQKENASYLNFGGSNNITMVGQDVDTMSLSLNSDYVLVVNSTCGFEALYWTPVIALGESSYNHPQICHNLDELKSEIIPKSKKNIRKFLYYSIFNFHYSQNINAKSVREWIIAMNKIKSIYLKEKMGS